MTKMIYNQLIEAQAFALPQLWRRCRASVELNALEGLVI